MENVQRGEIWWADLPEPRRSEPGFLRPVFIVQADAFTRSRIQTVIVAVITSNIALRAAPGNVLLPAEVSGLAGDSVIYVSQVLTLDKEFLKERVSTVPRRLQSAVDNGLRLALQL